MCTKPSECCHSEAPGRDEWLVVLVLIANDPHMLSRAEIQRELALSKDSEPPDIESAIEALNAAGLVNVCGELVGSSRAARYMDELLGSPA
jgi:hypothetical protein